MAWDQLNMAKEDFAATPTKDNYAEVLSCLDALSSILHSQPLDDLPEGNPAPSEEEGPLPINLAENTAQLESIQKEGGVAWFVRWKSEGGKLIFHLETHGWARQPESGYIPPGYQIATQENAELVAEYAQRLTCSEGQAKVKPLTFQLYKLRK